jgi:hypothetical protein
MTLEDAIDLVETNVSLHLDYSNDLDEGAGRKALTLVLAAAKRPYALSEGARKELQDLLESAMLHPYRHKKAAITAAINLAAAPSALSDESRKVLEGLRDLEIFIDENNWFQIQPEGGPLLEGMKPAIDEALALSPPFTREDLETFRRRLKATGFADDAALLAKLDAHLESLPQSSKAER